MFLSKLFSRRPQADAVADALYALAVARARAPVFYRDLGVPDTLEGRFEMISLHVYMLLRRLKQGADGSRAGGGAIGQALFDLMFADMDRNLREMGAGDLGVGRRVKAMAQAFYGRIQAYDDGLAAGAEILAQAVARNVYGGPDGGDAVPVSVDDGARALAAYLAASVAVLDAVSDDVLGQGVAAFAPLPEAVS